MTPIAGMVSVVIGHTNLHDCDPTHNPSRLSTHREGSWGMNGVSGVERIVGKLNLSLHILDPLFGVRGRLIIQFTSHTAMCSRMDIYQTIVTTLHS